METERVAMSAGSAALKLRADLLASSRSRVQDPALGDDLVHALSSVRDLLAADSVSFLVADETGTELVGRTSVGLSERLSTELHIGVGAGVAGRVFATREPLVVQDLGDVETASPLLVSSGIKSLVAVPVMTERSTIGVLHAGSFEPSYFSDSDVAALTLVADGLAAAMERASLQDSEDQAEQRATDAAVLISHLQRISLALSQDVSEPAVARILSSEVAKLADGNLTSCTVWLRDRERLLLVRPEEAPDSARSFVEIPLSAHLPGALVTRTGEAMFFEDLDELTRRFPAIDRSTLTGQRIAVLPLRTRTMSFGVLAFSLARPGEFAPHERSFIHGVAQQAAQAFERARLRALEQRVARHDAILSRLSATLALSLDYKQTLAQIVNLLVPALSDIATVHLLDDDGRLQRVASRHRDPALDAAIKAIEEPMPAVVVALNEVMKSQDFFSFDFNELDDGNQNVLARDAFEVMKPLGVRSVLLARLSDRGRILGMLSVGRTGESPTFDVYDGALFVEIARRAAVAIANSRMHAELAEARRVEGFLLDVATALSQVSGYVETLERLGAVAVPTLGDVCIIDLVGEDGELERVVAHHSDPQYRTTMRQIRDRFPPRLNSLDHPSVQAIRTGRSVLVPELTTDIMQTWALSEEHYEILKQTSWRSYLAVPLISHGAVVGALGLLTASRTYNWQDVEIAERLASQVSSVVEQARRYEQEHRISHFLQSSLLPTDLPVVPGIDLAVRYLPGTKDAEVGGDFYDAMLLPSGELALTVGDVAGHDHQAAAVMGRLRSSVRTLDSHLSGPVEVIESLQRHWPLLGLDRIATAVFCHFEPASRALTLAIAGHPPPLLVSPRGAKLLPVRPTAPLGAPSRPAEAWTGQLAPDEVLVLYTDGLIDDRSRPLSEALQDLVDLAGSGPLGVEALLDRLVSSIGTERSDDVALLAIKIRPPLN